MNKMKFVFLAFSPILLGYIFNVVILLPIMSNFLSWIFPFIQLIYWFWVGKKFSLHIDKPANAILLGNIFGIISLLVYFWQFVTLTDVNRNLWLAGFSQMFSCSLSGLSFKIVILLNLNSGAITQALVNSIQVTGLVLMISVFSIGYIYGRKQRIK